MGRLHKTLKKFSLMRKVFGDKTFDSMHPMGTATEGAYDARKAAVKAVKDAENQPAIPLPDEDELERVRRKRAASRTGGRSSTVLTDEDRLGG